MKKARNRLIKNLRYLCLVGVFALGLLTIVATGGGPSPTPPKTYNISGRVVVNGIGMSGVTVMLSGDAIDSTTTDNDGYYLFSGLLNGSYTVTPSLNNPSNP